ncbi:MAG: hypothetical protein ACR2G3_03395 [Solirubrobacterales bacterium]
MSASEPQWGDPPPNCAICGEQTHWFSARLCKRCKSIWDRLEFRYVANKPEWERALTQAWDPETECFLCQITGVELVVGKEHWPHPRYLEREHVSPGDDTAYVVCASIINRMKGSMTEPEFRDAVHTVADVYRGKAHADADLLRARIKTSLTPDELREIVLGLDATFRGGKFPAEILMNLDPARSGRRTPDAPG